MLRASGGRERAADDTTRSPTRISPAVGSTKPAIRRKVVVLPQPDGPSRQTNRPWSIRNETSSTTANASYRLVKFRSSTDATQVLLMLPPPLAQSDRICRSLHLAPLAGRGRPRKPRGNKSVLAPGENRLALFHECAAAF